MLSKANLQKMYGVNTHPLYDSRDKLVNWHADDSYDTIWIYWNDLKWRGPGATTQYVSNKRWKKHESGVQTEGGLLFQATQPQTRSF